MTNDRTTGAECIGSVPWGTHVCEFHSNREELADTLVPYFASGLQRDEFCLWVTSDPSGAEGARIGLKKAAPYLDRYLDTGQIEIWDCRDWYLRGGQFDADRVFGQWVEKERWSLDTGYKGLRATGDTAWLESGDWPDFLAYEAEVNRVLPQHRMIGLCTYSLDGCPAAAALEVVRHHQFALGRIDGECEIIESFALKIAKGQSPVSRHLHRLPVHLLERQDEELRWIASQLHEVTAQNVRAIAVYLAGLQQSTSARPSGVEFIVAKAQALCEQSLEQILTLSHRLHPPMLDIVGLAGCLHWYIEDFMKQSSIHVEFETGPEIGRLPLEMETHLFRVAQEGLSNIRHSESLSAAVRLKRQTDHVILQIEDFGRGMPATATTAVSSDAEEAGLGIARIQERLRKIGGRLEVRSSNQGTMLTASVRLS